MIDATCKSQLLTKLREQISCGSDLPSESRRIIPTRLAALDRVLPRKGLRAGSLIECLAEQSGFGALGFLLQLTMRVCQRAGVMVVVDRRQEFYPAALPAAGLPYRRVVIVRVSNEADELWAADQALRCRGVRSVWVQRERLRPHDFRRLSLAAEIGGGVGMLLRPLKVRGQPSWADVQFCIQPRPSAGTGRRMQLEVTRCRGGQAGQSWELEVDDVTGVVREVDPHEEIRVFASAGVADSTVAGRAARAARPAASCLSSPSTAG